MIQRQNAKLERCLKESLRLRNLAEVKMKCMSVIILNVYQDSDHEGWILCIDSKLILVQRNSQKTLKTGTSSSTTGFHDYASSTLHWSVRQLLTSENIFVLP